MPNVILPTLHAGQVRVWNERARFNRVRCGRRWGKTEFGKTVGGSQASKGRSVGWFAPDYKIQSEAYNELLDIITPIKKQASKIEGRMETTTGGRIDFWSLENERAGRSRKYHDVIIDEAAFTKPNMVEIWERSIKPTLFDLGGRAWVLSTPNGTAADNFFYLLNDVEKFGFKDHHAPTADNPLLPLIRPGETPEEWMERRVSELLKLKNDNHPLVYQQEYLAEFVDWSGTAFFSVASLLDAAGNPYDMPTKCDAVFAVIDTAIKTGSKNDGTGVTFYALMPAVLGREGRLIVLDWDIVQIEGSLLESWLPTVYERLEELATMTGARMGTTLGVFIEDKASGIILLQQAARRGWNARPIDGKLTAMGKDERAISVSGYVYRGEVKICRYAYEKVKKYKEVSRNHFLTQVTGFRIGVKDQADDLFDTFCYGISIALGNTRGY